MNNRKLFLGMVSGALIMAAGIWALTGDASYNNDLSAELERLPVELELTGSNCNPKNKVRGNAGTCMVVDVNTGEKFGEIEYGVLRMVNLGEKDESGQYVLVSGGDAGTAFLGVYRADFANKDLSLIDEYRYNSNNFNLFRKDCNPDDPKSYNQECLPDLSPEAIEALKKQNLEFLEMEEKYTLEQSAL